MTCGISARYNDTVFSIESQLLGSNLLCGVEEHVGRGKLLTHGRNYAQRKSKLLKCLTHCINSNTVVVCNKGGGKADDDRISTPDQNSDLFRAVRDLLCVLGAHNKAMTAQNALIADNMGLVTRKADSLNRAVTDTLITVLAV